MKKIIGLLFSLGMIFSMVVPSVSQAAVSFTDVPAGHRFYNEINYLAGREIITGFPGGTFRPDATVNRGQAAIMIGRALGLNGTQRSTTFSDVDSSQVASGFIASAVEKKIISGFPDGTYRPNDTVTRGQMAIFLSRAFNLTKEANVAFPDVTSEQAAYVHIKRILAAGLTAGFLDGTYRPNNLVKRSDFSAFMSRALDPRFKTKTENSRNSPASPGETVIVEGKDYLDGNRKYEMELVDKITDGATAWQMIKEANMFNDPPPAGQKYILVKFRFKALEMESETLEAYSVYFEAVSKDGVVYESAIVVQPEPDLWADLYEGGEYEGWAAFLINENDQPLIVWQREWDDESWFTLE